MTMLTTEQLAAEFGVSARLGRTPAGRARLAGVQVERNADQSRGGACTNTSAATLWAYFRAQGADALVGFYGAQRRSNRPWPQQEQR